MVMADESIARIGRLRVLPVAEIPTAEAAIPLAEALASVHLDIVEITFRTDAAADAIRAIRNAHPEVLVGAGTLLTRENVDAALAAGANFLVAPGYRPAVVDYAILRGATMIPGVCTPSEIEAAMARGLRVLKFFPAEASGGTAFLKAVSATYPSVNFVPTGGIGPSNLATYLALPNVLACGGSWMVKHALLESGDFSTIQHLAGEAMALARASHAIGSI